MTLYEYIWIDGSGNLRSKTKVIHHNKWCLHYMMFGVSLKDLPVWNYDGSSTGQAKGNDSEVLLKPVYMCNDPFRESGDKLVLCQTLNKDYHPHISNTRHEFAALANSYNNLEPMYGFEQEFFVLNSQEQIAGFDEDINSLTKQGDYYCGVGNKNIRIREFGEEVMRMCLNAGLSVTGMNAEVAPSQWEVQVCDKSVEAADQLYVLRYILNRVAEKYGYNINIVPKPFTGEWNGSGCHANFSTKPMRTSGGLTQINKCIDNLSKLHKSYMQLYGDDNDKRMTGTCETASFNDFTYGVGDRTASIRIPTCVNNTVGGYLEDRRPGSNIDPYIVSRLLLESVI